MGTFNDSESLKPIFKETYTAKAKKKDRLKTLLDVFKGIKKKKEPKK